MDRQDNEGTTCLHLVCALDMEGRCIDYLLGHKATAALADTKGYNALHYAAAAGNSTAVQHLLEFGGSELFTAAGLGDQGVTPVHLASYNGHRDALVILLSRYVQLLLYVFILHECYRFTNIDLGDNQGRSPLYLASYSGKSDCVSLLLENGAMVTRYGSTCDLTPVHVAAAQGHVETLRLLLDNTEEASVVDTPATSVSATPLMLATYPGHVSCVQLLLQYGSNIRARDISGRSAVMWAVFAGQEECVRILLSAAGSDTCYDTRGRSPHHVAAAHGQVIVLGTLLSSSVKEVSLADNDGFTPVHYAAYYGQEGTLDMLLQTEACRLQNDNISSFSPLHCAMVSGSEQCLQLLLSADSQAAVNSADAAGFTPLHIAAAKNLQNSSKLLISKGADINAKDAKSRTPIMLASAAGNVNIIELLLEEKADYESSDSDGNTALHFACAKAMSKSANLFLRNSSSEFVCKQNRDGKTALHLAAGQGLVETTELLLAAGASVTCVDAQVGNLTNVFHSNFKYFLQGNPPALDCAANEDKATCLAMILSVYLATPDQSETRRSLIGQLRKSDIFCRLSAGLKELELDESPAKTNGSEHNSHCSSDTEYF